MCDAKAPGARVVEVALSLWRSTIVDPRPGAAKKEFALSQIDGFIRGEQGLHWGWESAYKGDGDFEWCGAFAAHCWGAAGLAERWRSVFFASTYRLDRWAAYRPVGRYINPAPSQDQPRRLYCQMHDHTTAADLAAMCVSPLEGDILLIGKSGTGYGTHICIVESYDPGLGVFATIEGNARGRFPDGTRGQGVVRNERPLEIARRLIRPAPGDLQ